ncbi:MAG TPA: hypothetical protein HPP56_00765 [Nitrospirae bacterium]|nr:hypothetical protein [Nitrospirota bacterium]
MANGLINFKIALRKGCFRLFIIDKFCFIHYNAMPYDKTLGTFFIRCRIKIPHQPFLADFI